MLRDEIIRDRYESLWNPLKTNFQNAVLCLEEYCGYGDSFAFDRTYKHEIKTILKKYKELYKLYPYSIAYSVEFLLLQLPENKNISDISDFNVMRDIICNKTGIDPHKLPSIPELLYRESQGNKFEKTINTLREFSKLNDIFPIIEYMNCSNEISSVLELYDGSNGFIAKHENSLLCTPELLIYQVLNLVSKEHVKTKFFLNSLMRLNYAKTSTFELLKDKMDFIVDKLLDKEININISNAMKYSNWIDCIEGNRYFMNQSHKNKLIHDLYGYKLIDHEHYIRYCINAGLFGNFINQFQFEDNNRAGMLRLFDAALNKKEYYMARYIASKFNSQNPHVFWGDDPDETEFKIFYDIFFELFISDPHIQDRLIDHLLMHYRDEVTNPNQLYFLICNNWMIDNNWKYNQDKFDDNFKMDFNYIFYSIFNQFNISEKYKSSIHIITGKKLDLELDWYMNNNGNFSYTRTDDATFTITPLQASVVIYMRFLYEVTSKQKIFAEYLNAFASYSDELIFRKDGRGNDILRYLKEVKKHHNKKNDLDADLSSAINLYEKRKMRCVRSKLYSFFRGKDEILPGYIPIEVCAEIGKNLIALEGLELQPKLSIRK